MVSLEKSKIKCQNNDINPLISKTYLIFFGINYVYFKKN